MPKPLLSALLVVVVALPLSAEEPFSRGDVNGGGIDISDPIYLLFHLFAGDEAPPCLDAADSNDSGTLDVADAVQILCWLFIDGDAPPVPFPDCGFDPTEDGLGCAASTAGCANQAPAIDSSPSTTASSGEEYRYDVAASDENEWDSLAFSLLEAPSNASIDVAAGRILWIPAVQQVGARAFRVRVTDRGGLFAEQDFTVQVTRGSPVPVEKRALCVIADFADTALEDYSGMYPDAIRSEADLQAILADMESHWAWLSQGAETVLWDLVRVRLAQGLTSSAFADWGAFRTAVAQAALGQVAVEDYDSDGDGVLDVLYIIASCGDAEYDYLIGGASRNGGAAVFVDGQASLSLRVRATGNFNHETGHCFGLPDIYGDYDTIHYLTLMSDSWPVPPNGLTSWEKAKLGWMEPRRVEESMAGIVLYPAEDNFQAVVVPTLRPSEFFLIEYRRRPSSGFGSDPWVQFDGLAIYHILEARMSSGNNRVLPQLLRLEPPDGNYDEYDDPMLTDFWYPGNPRIAGSFEGHPYYNQAAIACGVGNLERTEDGGMRFDVEVLSHTMDATSLAANGGFEQGAGGMPTGWTKGAWVESRSTFTWSATGGTGNSRCVRIVNNSANDASWQQTVTGLTVGEIYLASVKVKVERIAMTEGGDVGANLSLLGTWDRSPSINHACEWTTIQVAFEATSSSATIGCRLGHWYSTVTGAALFDDFTVEPLLR
jgi:hypothetical protein